MASVAPSTADRPNACPDTRSTAPGPRMAARIPRCFRGRTTYSEVPDRAKEVPEDPGNPPGPALRSVESRLTWLPAALAGAAGAASAELAVGLLLYVRGGFLGALTLILCAEAAALAFGLWSAPRDGDRPWSGVRRAWFVLLLSLV